MADTSTSPFDRPTQQVAAIVVFCAAAAAFLGLPVILGALADLRGMAPDQLGQIASAETFGVAVTAALSPWLTRRIGVRTLMLLGMVVLALSNVGSCLVTDFAPFVVIRLAASIASGLAMPAAVACLGRASNPERVFSWLVSAQIALGAAELFGFAFVARQFGVIGIYATLAALAVLAGTGAFRIAYVPPQSTSIEQRSALTPASRAGLAGVMLFFACIGGYWAFIERVGVMAHLNAEEVGTWLAASSVPALVASLSAPWVARRIGEQRMLLLGLAIAAAVPLGLMLPLQPLSYLLNLSVFVLLWNSLMVVQMALLGRWDAQGLAVSLTPAAQGLGLALAPLLAGELADRRGYPTAMALASACAALAFLATWYAFSRRAQEVRGVPSEAPSAAA